MKGARAVGRHFDPAPARHGPGRVIAAAQGLGGANAAPKWWFFVPVPEERTKREPFCSAPPTTKLQAKPGVGRRRLPSVARSAARRCFSAVCIELRERQPWGLGCGLRRSEAAARTMAISSGGAADGASRRGHGCWRGRLVARGVRGARLQQALGRGHPFEWRARAVDEGPVLHSASSPIGSSPPSGRYWSAARKQQFRGTVRVVDKLYHGVVSLERFLCELTMPKPLPRRAAANPTQYNVDAIAKLEHDALGRRTLTERVSDVITKLVGNTGFLLAQLLLICGWSLINLRVIPGVRTFDPFPFGGLALVISCESVFLTIFVLISQGRMARQSERRSHLDLQVGMLSEQELTTILQMLQKLCQHMGVDVGSSEQEVQSFSKTTDVHKLASELEEKLPEK